MKRQITVPLLFVLLGSVIGSLYLGLPFVQASYPLDDAWIHMVYARNLAEGHFFSYNPPEPEAGFSSPLWLLISAFLHLFTDNVLAPKIAGLVFLILLAFCARRLGGLWAGLFILLDPLLHFAALSGMEVTLFSLLSLTALERQLAGKPGQAGWAAAGALLSRPEGILLFGILPLLEFKKKTSLAPLVKRWIWLTAPMIAAAGLWIFYCLQIAGRPFPNTFYVKLGSPLPGQSPIDLWIGFLANEGFLFPVVITLLVLSALVFRPDRRTAALFLFTLLLFLGVWSTRPILSVESFYWQRYLLPSLPGIHVLAGIGIQGLWSRAAPLKALAFYLGLGVLIGQVVSLDAKRELYSNNCRDVFRYNVAAGRWIKENTPPDDRIAVLDAGALRYFGAREIIDLGGLNARDLSDLSFLDGKIDARDPMILAAYTGADWIVIPFRHVFGPHWRDREHLRVMGANFTLLNLIRYEDYSLYKHPEPFLLLFLKKGR